VHPSFIKFCVGVFTMAADTIITEVSVKARNKASLQMYDSAISHAAKMEQAVKNGDISEGFGLNLIQGKKPVDAAMAAISGSAPAASSEEEASPHSGTSQLSAAGRACIPCGNDHFSTVSGLLAEAMRFARASGIGDPEVIKRISLAEDELNAFERVDAAPDKIAALPDEERDIINAMTQDSREIRHNLSDLKSPEDLLQLAADVKKIREGYRMQVFGLQLAKI
jgi:hypothetical protein